jgi:hypothetical protein
MGREETLVFPLLGKSTTLLAAERFLSLSDELQSTTVVSGARI